MHIYDLLPQDLLDRHVADGLVFKRPHRDFGYFIYGYAPQVQYIRAWDEVTLNCRGLITDADGEVIARGFPKFFNVGELEAVPDGPHDVFEKADGSLCIPLLGPDGRVYMSTRGSFHSEQAQWATQFVHGDPGLERTLKDALEAGTTPLFEAIYPGNRIVCHYGDRQELVLLAVLDTATARDVDLIDWPTVVQHHQGLTLPEVLERLDGPFENREGFVIRWADGTRAKAKYSEYVRTHGLVFGMTTKVIWEMLSARQSLDRLIEVVPDEFFAWVKEQEATLNQRFSEIERDALAFLAEVPRDASRKEQADLILAKATYPNLVFMMLDQKDYAAAIWKMIRPETVAWAEEG